MSSFEELVDDGAGRAALDRLRDAAGAVGGPMERHCLRTRLIAARLAELRGWPVDNELLTVAAILHDAGLYPGISRGGVYTADGAAASRELLSGLGWEQARIERCANAIDRHHDLRSQRALGNEVEVLRLADLVDVSAGLIRFGLEREWLRELMRTVPRTGLAGELAREVGRALRERPLSMVKIFRRP